MTQKLIAELFGKSVSTINEHIKNIYNDAELDEASTLRKFGISEFSTKPTNFYNLDMIISVGYRVNSRRATQVLKGCYCVIPSRIYIIVYTLILDPFN